MQQLGFDLEYLDPLTHKQVPWAEPTPDLLSLIQNAPWKVVDIETTGLNPSSKEQTFSAKDLRRGVNPRLRLRVLSILFPLPIGGYRVEAFEFDRLKDAEKKAVCDAAFDPEGVVIGHNVGFDAYWIRRFTRKTPKLLLDTMLLARVLRPEQPLVLARMANDDNEDESFRQAAIEVFQQSRSGWSLADLAMSVLRRILPKDLQGPKNWCQPFLTQANYEYASSDSIVAYELLLNLLEIGQDDDLLVRYYEVRYYNPVIQLIEPQVMDIVFMREKGMPWSVESAEKYVESQWEKVAQFASSLCEMEPSLVKYQASLGNAEEGVKAELRQMLGEAFRNRGLVLDSTEKTGLPMIGEKDLRRAKAQVNEAARPLFDAWVGLARAKKAGGMAREVSDFAIRSGDARLHPNTGHGPVTGRLSSSEPNCQQFPRDQGFRNCVQAREGFKIVASDYSALDMRVGAALAIRAQREIFEAYMGDRAVSPEVLKAIARVLEGKLQLPQAQREEAEAKKLFEAWKLKREKIADSGDARKAYWDRYRTLARTVLMTRFCRCYAEVRLKAELAGTPDWGSLRDAFSIAGMDIHTWTALGMIGKDPMELFSGKENDLVVKELKGWKKELGDKRQTGKVGNLSLLYAMQTQGLVDAAAKNYNIHWSFEEADSVRNQWLATYVEIDLWHAWTELTPTESVYIPDPERGNKFVKKAAYASYTLADRLIYAFGLNAALSYQDQSSGADIMGSVMDHLHRVHPAVFDTICNQVHDELVFEIPNEHVEGWTQLIQDVMVEQAEKYLMPFGVRGECSPAIGDVWLKD